jgi:FkbM family methyltransferase
MNEFARAHLVREIVAFLPAPLKRRVARTFYNYNSSNLRGTEIVVDYIKDLNLRFAVNTKEFIGWNIFFTGAYEGSTNKVLRQFVKKGDVVVEAGANNGSETVLLGRLVGEQGKVFAFEPVPSVLKPLRKNIELNQLGSVVAVHELALGAEEREVMMHLMPGEAYNQGMSSTNPFPEAKERIVVRQTTLDQWARETNLQRLDLLKMDIQGGEFDLLCGGAETIQRFKPHIFCEADTLGSHTLQELHDKLEGFGYSVSWIHGKTAKLIPMDRNNFRTGNWWAIHQDRATR